MKKILAILLSIIMMMCVISAPTGVKADFGDYAGDNDYGGGDDGGGWDSGGNDDSDWSGSGSDGDGDLFDIVILVAIVVFVIYKSKNSKSTTSNRPNTSVRRTNSFTYRNIEEYLHIDPDFSETQFKDKVSNLYIQFQEAWQAKDLSSLRPYLTDSAFAKFDRQLDNYRQNHTTNYVDHPAVLNVHVRGWYNDGNMDVMVVELRTRIIDYVKDDASGVIVKGSDSIEKFMTYEWKLVRTHGVTTRNSTGTSAKVCPYCGAHVDINHSAVCEYCDSVLTTDEFDWAVSEISGISQRSYRI